MTGRPLPEHVASIAAGQQTSVWGQDAREEQEAPKEVIQANAQSQKEAMPDPDRLPQAIFPGGQPAWYRRPVPAQAQDHLHIHQQLQRYHVPPHQQTQSPRGHYPSGAVFISADISTTSRASSSRPSTALKSITHNETSASDDNHPDVAESAASGGGAGGNHNEAGEAGRQRRKCGMSRRKFWFVAVGTASLIILGVVLGIVLGVSQLRAGQAYPGSSTKATSTGSPIPVAQNLLAGSRLAAVNWTDSSNHTRRAILSQDLYSSLIIWVTDSQNNTWSSPINITDILSGSGNPIRLKTGSPLAATAVGEAIYAFQMDVFYLTPENTIGHIFTMDRTYNLWRIGDLSAQTSLAPKLATGDSSLSAMTHVCVNRKGCPGYTYVAFQDYKGLMNLLNSSDWASAKSTLGREGSGGAVAMGQASGLALIPFTGARDNSSGLVVGDRDGGVSDDPAGLRLFWTTESRLLVEARWNQTAGWGDGATLGPGVPREPRPQFAASPFDAFHQALTVSRMPGGSLLGYRYRDGAWSSPGVNITFRGRAAAAAGGSAPNFTSIAMDYEGSFYGTVVVSNWWGGPFTVSLEHYRWSAEDPFVFDFAGWVGLDNVTGPSSYPTVSYGTPVVISGTGTSSPGAGATGTMSAAVVVETVAAARTTTSV